MMKGKGRRVKFKDGVFTVIDFQISACETLS